MAIIIYIAAIDSSIAIKPAKTTIQSDVNLNVSNWATSKGTYWELSIVSSVCRSVYVEVKAVF